MPNFFLYYNKFWDWRKKRKSSWRKRFALWPIKLGFDNDRSNIYIWLGIYYSKGTFNSRPGRIVPRTEFNDPFYSSGFSYWKWHRVRSKEQRIIN